MFGKLTSAAFKQDFIEHMAGLSMLLALLAIVALITYTKRWKWLWVEWLTSLDHKRIGIMYIAFSALMLFKGLIDAVMMRVQQAFAVGDSMGYLTGSHFQQIFTAHGATMIFFVGMGVIFGLINLVLPIQIGARDVAFPFLNNISFWLFTSGGLFILASLVIGKYAGTGWVSYPPLSGIKYNPGTGVDYWLWSVQISGAGSLLSGINFMVTIFKMRCPGMSLMKMPIFVWGSLATMVLVIFAFPILTANVAMLSSDRLLGTHFFTSDYGGNPMMYINLIWAWGHPEVYILILPAFGIFSEVVPVFSQKRLFGYASMVWAIVAITFLSFIVWLHHFFTMGAGANVNSFFGIMTMIIAVPTGVKVFNWLFTMFRGRIVLTTPMYWFLAFIGTFTVGGIAGVLMSIPAIDFQVHNSLFLIAHFHSVIIGGVVFGFFCGYSYWFPKFTGFKLNEPLGKCAFWFWFIGFLTAFIPLYILGLMGATRRLNHYAESTGWQPLFLVAGLGALLILIGVGFQVLQLVVSIKQRNQNRDTTGDPWNGRTLEWSIPSPAPFYNFAATPEVHERDPFWAAKQATIKEKPRYEEIHLPSNTGLGFYFGALSFLFGFGVIWFMWWLVIATAIGMVACLIIRLAQNTPEYTLKASEVEKIETEIRNRYV
ncbi:MAG: cytochrome o ubiquinol oxidase subunit I [Simkaniaceae bacterium]|nr:cytochrome o ubiquinol oxidase subunit I [Simkaniaceae bacterium]MCF7852826.1 cytochrome o ubiquinol oxidase subunit I [Simkaniaceae bacterium]